ncbi:MAG: exonuclease domain-containing protein [Candidatus Margulisiibacteriota bacterium]
MITDLLKDKQFQELEKEYKFLSRVRGESLDNLDCVIFDIETTGLDPTTNEITEIGAMKSQGAELKDIFSSLVKPKASISAEITRLTGIDNDLVKDAPSIDKVLPKFIEFIDAAVLIAHNADFDVSFVKEQLKKTSDKELINGVICTVKVARYLLPGLTNHKLHTVASHFGLKAENRHRAMGDAELTFQVWTKFLPLLKEKQITTKRELDVLVSRL